MFEKIYILSFTLNALNVWKKIDKKVDIHLDKDAIKMHNHYEPLIKYLLYYFDIKQILIYQCTHISFIFDR